MKLGYESEDVEFKKSTGELKEGIQSLAAMLNKSGQGTLYFGVRNDGTVIGQQISDTTLRGISQAIAVGIRPQVIPTISVQLMDDKNVVVIAVSGGERPYSAYGKYYIRVADEDREMHPHQLRNLMLSASDSIVNIEADQQELTFNQLKTLYAGERLTVREETFLQNLNLLTREGRYNLLASLLADDNSFSVKVAVFAGKDKTRLIKRNEYGYKCLLLAAKQVLDYAEALNESSVDLSGGQRRESRLFDQDCFREAWYNACLHNRWSRKTSPAVYVYEDRVEIVSVGGLPEGLTLEEFYMGKSKPVNLELQRIMAQLNFVEQTGHGVPLIVSRYGRQVFDVSENFLTVTLPFRRERTENVTYHISTPDSRNSMILDMMREDNRASIGEISDELGISKTAVNNRVKRLKEEGYLAREGGARDGSWVVLK